MKRLLGILVLLIVGCTGSGCTTLLFMDQRAVGVDSDAVSLGASRQEVELALGQPVASRPLPDGGQVDTYRYAMRPKWNDIFPELRGMPPALWVFFNLGMIGIPDAVAFPGFAMKVLKNQRNASLTYDADGHVVGRGAPPAYGPSDDSVGSFSLDEIKVRCRSEAADGASSLKCVVRRMGIWGIE